MGKKTVTDYTQLLCVYVLWHRCTEATQSEVKSYKAVQQYLSNNSYTSLNNGDCFYAFFATQVFS